MTTANVNDDIIVPTLKAMRVPHDPDHNGNLEVDYRHRNRLLIITIVVGEEADTIVLSTTVEPVDADKVALAVRKLGWPSVRDALTCRAAIEPGHAEKRLRVSTTVRVVSRTKARLELRDALDRIDADVRTLRTKLKGCLTTFERDEERGAQLGRIVSAALAAMNWSAVGGQVDPPQRERAGSPPVVPPNRTNEGKGASCHGKC